MFSTALYLTIFYFVAFKFLKLVKFSPDFFIKAMHFQIYRSIILSKVSHKVYACFRLIQGQLKRFFSNLEAKSFFLLVPKKRIIIFDFKISFSRNSQKNEVFDVFILFLLLITFSLSKFILFIKKLPSSPLLSLCHNAVIVLLAQIITFLLASISFILSIIFYNE